MIVWCLLIALSLFLVVAFFLLRDQFFTERVSPNLPKGVMGWPLLGETLAFLKPHRSNLSGDFLEDHISRYGRVFKSHLFGSPAIVSCDQELNMFILQNEEKLFRADYPKAVHGIVGRFSLLTASGEQRKKLRSNMVSYIHSSRSNPGFLQSVEKLAASMLGSWKCSNEIPFHKEARKFTFGIIAINLLSLEPEGPVASKILEDFNTYMKGFLSLPINIPGSAYAKAVKARARIASTVNQIIREREKDKVAKGDFLDVILSKQRLSNEEIIGNILDIMLGGYETTATVISLVVYFLGHSPTSFETLKKEHEAIRNSKGDTEPLNLEDYQKMEFTHNVIWEALRCGNVAKFLHRKALQDVTFKDYFIPSGWIVLPILAGVHFDPSLHENPFEFNPWRWADKATSKNVMPFGGGPRFCTGSQLAEVEIAFFLHHLMLTNYRWKIRADDFPLAKPYVEFTKGLLLEIETIDKDDRRQED